MGTPPLTSRPVHGGRSLDEVLRDKGAGRGLREAPPAPLNLGLSPSAHKPASAKVGGPPVAPWGTAAAVLSPYHELQPGSSCWSCGWGEWGGGTILTFLKQWADQSVHHYLMCVAVVYVSINAYRYVHTDV